SNLAFNNADLGNFASGIDDDKKFGPFDPGGYVGGLNIEWPAGRAKEVDDPARKIEQRPSRLARWQNPQCRTLIEAYHLTGVFQPCSVPPRAHLVLNPLRQAHRPIRAELPLPLVR